MPFILTELVVESILRDGLLDMRESFGTSRDQVDDVFGELTAAHLNVHYGDAELEKIKKLIKEPIQIVQGFPLTDVKPPLVSINLVSDSEVESQSAMDDFLEETDVDVAPTVLMGPLDADSYNDKTGMVVVDTANPNLATLRVGNVFVDGSAAEFSIVGGITNDTGDKRFAIAKGQTVNLVGVKVVSPLSIERTLRRAVRDTESLQLAIMTENQLATKYLYTVVKYILVSRKMDMLARGVEITTFDGSDFARTERLPENVFTRFITLRSRFVEHSWSGEKLNLIDSVDGAILVKRDLVRREDEDDYYLRTVVEEE